MKKKQFTYDLNEEFNFFGGFLSRKYLFFVSLLLCLINDSIVKNVYGRSTGHNEQIILFIEKNESSML